MVYLTDQTGGFATESEVELSPEEVAGILAEAAETQGDGDLLEADPEIAADLEARIAAEDAARAVTDEAYADSSSRTENPTGYVDAGPTLAGVENRNQPSSIFSTSGLWGLVTERTAPILRAALTPASNQTSEVFPVLDPESGQIIPGEVVADSQDTPQEPWYVAAWNGFVNLISDQEEPSQPVDRIAFEDSEVEDIVVEAPRREPRSQPQQRRVAERRQREESCCPSCCTAEDAAVSGAQMAGNLPVEELSEDELTEGDEASVEGEETAVASSDVVTPAPASAQGESTSGQQGNSEEAVATTLGENSTPQTISQNPVTNRTVETDSGETPTVVAHTDATAVASGAPLAGMASGAVSTEKDGITLGKGQPGLRAPVGTGVTAVSGTNNRVEDLGQASPDGERVGVVAVRGENGKQTGQLHSRVSTDPKEQAVAVGISPRARAATKAREDRKIALDGDRKAREPDARTAPVLVANTTVARNESSVNSDISAFASHAAAQQATVSGSGDKGFDPNQQGRDTSAEGIYANADLDVEPRSETVVDNGPSQFDNPTKTDVVV